MRAVIDVTVSTSSQEKLFKVNEEKCLSSKNNEIDTQVRNINRL